MIYRRSMGMARFVPGLGLLARPQEYQRATETLNRRQSQNQRRIPLGEYSETVMRHSRTVLSSGEERRI
jgi:hypothetical protein